MERKIDAFGDVERLDKMAEILETHLLLGTMVTPDNNGGYMLCRVIPKSTHPVESEWVVNDIKKEAKKLDFPFPQELTDESFKTIMSMVYSKLYNVSVTPDMLQEGEENVKLFNTLYKNLSRDARLFTLRTNPESDFDRTQFRDENDFHRMRASNYILNYIRSMPEDLKTAHMELVFAAYKNYLSVLFTVEDSKLKEAMEQAGKRIGALCAAYDKNRFNEIENAVLESKLEDESKVK